MAKAVKTKKSKTNPKGKARRAPFRWLLWQGFRLLCVGFVLVIALILLFAVVNPPTTIYMSQESRRLGGVDHEWVSIEEIAPVMARSVVAAEDANFCQHWGFDLNAIKVAIAAGGHTGASTISQQTVKNVFLWHGRNFTRKGMEALMTPLVEAVWSKRRIVEVYLNVAEFDEGVFGVEAAARHYFGVGLEELSATQAARLAAILPSPKTRSASRPTNSVRKRTRQIIDGAATIRADGRSACFES
jgi:monofunctional biosynthetic peptidoglycan transglycosylase